RFVPVERLSRFRPLTTTVPSARRVIDPAPQRSTISCCASTTRLLPATCRSCAVSSVAAAALARVCQAVARRNPTTIGRAGSPFSKTRSTGRPGTGASGTSTMVRAARGPLSLPGKSTSGSPPSPRPASCPTTPSGRWLAADRRGWRANATTARLCVLISVGLDLAPLADVVAVTLHVYPLALECHLAILLHCDLRIAGLETHLVLGNELDLLRVEDVLFFHRFFVLALDLLAAVLADLYGVVLAAALRQVLCDAERFRA